MMCTVFILVYRGSKSSLNPSWISLRREAERRRYEQLRTLNEYLRENSSSETAVDISNDLHKVMSEIAELQIAYNQSNATKYNAIEKISERLDGWFL